VRWIRGVLLRFFDLAVRDLVAFDISHHALNVRLLSFYRMYNFLAGSRHRLLDLAEASSDFALYSRAICIAELKHCLAFLNPLAPFIKRS
jgi:hypothetical protein